MLNIPLRQLFTEMRQLPNSTIPMTDGEIVTEIISVINSFKTDDFEEVIISGYQTIEDCMHLQYSFDDIDRCLDVQVGGLCTTGHCRKIYEDVLSNNELSESHREFMVNMLDKIYYNIDALLDMACTIPNPTPLTIRMYILYVIGHERRHAVQPPSLFDITVSILNEDTVDEYVNQPHELDADYAGYDFMVENF